MEHEMPTNTYGAGSREAKRAVGEHAEAAAGAAQPNKQPPDPELAERPKRRTFTADYKLKILAEADAATEPGEIGALCRREGQRSPIHATSGSRSWSGAPRAPLRGD